MLFMTSRAIELIKQDPLHEYLCASNICLEEMIVELKLYGLPRTFSIQMTSFVNMLCKSCYFESASVNRILFLSTHNLDHTH